jgi:cytochrome c oxidase cbb3-type subunit 3
MKKYIQSTAYILSLFIALYALHVALVSYENPFDIYENPLVWIILIGIIFMVVIKEVLNVVALEKAEKLEYEKQGIDPATIDNYAWFKKLMKKWTKSKDIEEEGEIVLDHNYDGIKELDNSLPPWWLYLFYATILFGVVYLVRFHIVGDYDQESEYIKEVEIAQREIEKYKEKAPKTDVFDMSTLAVLTDDASLNRGKALYNLNCVSCHKKDGGGGIGPNLTDEYWILGGGIKNVFNTIANGGRDGKGMVAWSKQYKLQEIQKIASYVMTLQGTTPQEPKKAEGELWEEEQETLQEEGTK